MAETHRLTETELQEVRAEIDRQLRKLEKSMAVTDEAMKPVTLDQSAVGRLSRIDALQNQGMTRNLQDRERAKLGQLLAALERMDAGTYGACESCGDFIAYDRLLVFPEAATCQGCAAAIS
jgi:DnaK suppressor protein